MTSKKQKKIVLPSAQPTWNQQNVFVRLVGLEKAGIPVNPEWNSRDKYVTLKPGIDDYDRDTMMSSESWTWPTDLRVRIDDKHTPMIILQHLVAILDELQHLRVLTANQLLDWVSLEKWNAFSGLLNEENRNKSFDTEDLSLWRCPEYTGCVRLPVLLVLAFPTTITAVERPLLPRNDDKPLLWLDVDGVVNGSVGSDEQQRLTCFNDLYCDVVFSPEIIRELNRLSTLCDIYWSTGWHKWARFRLAPLVGLDDFKVWPGEKGSLDNVVNFNRPLIWLDDYLDEESKQAFSKEMVQKVKEKFEHHLLIGPRLDESDAAKGFGLSMRHINQIDTFLTSLK
jgi:hypothetical protein